MDELLLVAVGLASFGLGSAAGYFYALRMVGQKSVEMLNSFLSPSTSMGNASGSNFRPSAEPDHTHERDFLDSNDGKGWRCNRCWSQGIYTPMSRLNDGA